MRRIIGYVPQMLSADGTLTGRENLVVFARLYDVPRRERKQRVEEALSFMGLLDAADRPVRQYSGGMIRRLEIAQSMIHNPRVLFLDEPTVGLDPGARRAVWEHIEELRDRTGATIVLTTHQMEEADVLCGRVAIMHQGVLVALGTPAELKASIGKRGATLDDVFIRYTGSELESGGTYGETRRTRRAVRRLGWARSCREQTLFPFSSATSDVRSPSRAWRRASFCTTRPSFSRARCSRPCGCSYSARSSPASGHSHGKHALHRFHGSGILSQSVLFISIFYGISIIWERDLGILHKFLVSPTPRSALVLGKAISAGLRGLTQGVIVYLLALVLGVAMDWNPLSLLGVVLAVMLGAAFFSTFSLVIACLVKTRERFMGIGQILTMPLFFASNAIYPISIMPRWLQVISHANPLTYQVDALRALMLSGGVSAYGVGTDLGILALATLVLVAVGSRLYPTIAT